MTRKDYVALAAALREQYMMALGDEGEVFSLETVRRDPATVKAIISAVADVLADDNPRFDYARFRKACGVEE